MKSLIPIIVNYIVLGAATGKEVCYGDLGCFTDAPPWSGTLERPKAKLPWSPEKINTRFFLLTRENPERHQTISARDLPGLNASSFSTSRRTIFIIHGMGDRAENNWVSDMCHELLLVEDVNCIGVDWRRGSGNVLLYVQAANNGRLVGAEIAHLLKRLQATLNYSPFNVHIIGHSLGAHIAGEAGKRCPGIHRITGLDPARPYFEYTAPEVRLDPSDASFVDVIHTDTEPLTGLGMDQPVGHYDFYPNGGKHMVGCPHKLVSLFKGNDLVQALGCDHFRAFLYYTDSIRSPGGFVSYPCDSYKGFTSGSCFSCPLQRCTTMGHHSEQSYNISDPKRKFYLNTGGSPPHFSSWRYKISIILNGTVPKKMYISLYGAGGDLTDHQLGSSFLVPKNTFSEFIDSPVKLHPLYHVKFHWTPMVFNIFRWQVGVTRLDIQTGEDGTISSFCATGTVLDNVAQVLGSCTDV
ncbi:pancreatic lipase-related protein 2-like isoform 2-T2 [Mantella aurantiaca]